MTTYHIHISGLVQGVGFRPFVYRLAEKLQIHGWVSNKNDGVHIEFNAAPGPAAHFYHEIISNPPPNAIITKHHFYEIASRLFNSFEIRESLSDIKPDLLFTPDIAMCAECRSELFEEKSRWFQYPFTTCLHCGPRYSIINDLPYDRERTTMSSLPVCESCAAEFNDVKNRRHFSQTISCPQCSIPMHLYDCADGTFAGTDYTEILSQVNELLGKGAIVGVKSTGGYLLLCDATNESSIVSLRKRKHRPAKPFALLYPGIERIRIDATLRRVETEALLSKPAPIVLCRLNDIPNREICVDLIAPGLNKIGVMLPHTPLLSLISGAFGKPLIATSGNISGSPIIYRDDNALEHLGGIADHLLTYDREIVTPQDDSVMQFAPCGQKIVIRRSRGLAPNYFPNPFSFSNETVLAMGGELKASFAILDHHNLYVSQYLGNQESVEAQTAYKHTLDHLFKMLQTKPHHILIDKHPGYFVSLAGKENALAENIPVSFIQHHKAHFGAVLAENNLLRSNEPILGITWDGSGYGDDGQVWGSEFFIYEKNEMKRVAHLDYFPHIHGNKMSREPRLSALSLLRNIPSKQKIIEPHFSEKEWAYNVKEIRLPERLQTSSMGRFLDGLASILGICQLNTYEGEAAMKLEAIASRHRHHSFEFYPLPLVNNRIDHSQMLSCLLRDLGNKEDISLMAWKIFCSLAKVIATSCDYFGIHKIAFSGGVFQNELLAELIIELLSSKNELYFHHQLSPNDECIGFGQLACYELFKKNVQTIYHKKTIETIVH